MTGYEYEYSVAKYLRQHGYKKVEVTKGSGDYGVDIIAHKKGKNMQSSVSTTRDLLVYLQCKKLLLEKLCIIVILQW